mmetsp:Transcript_98476/g.249951  ORF Transcript_98476/g.249951 Transcript_98476/m.249951 type:complete len:95 (-) Transcript_98476:23-307(-)
MDRVCVVVGAGCSAAAAGCLASACVVATSALRASGFHEATVKLRSWSCVPRRAGAQAPTRLGALALRGVKHFCRDERSAIAAFQLLATLHVCGT